MKVGGSDRKKAASLTRRAREHRNRADQAQPEQERPLDQVAEATLEPGLEPREVVVTLCERNSPRPSLRL